MLTPNTLHIYKLRWRDIPATPMQALLSEDEQQRMDKYKIHDDKMRFCIGRGALRSLGAQYLNVMPESLQLAVNDYGKPFFQPPHDKLFFNISHSGDWVVIAFANSEVGVDVEGANHSPKFDFRNVVKHTFHADEIAVADSIDKFYDIWVCKEAAIKALGVGLHGQLQELSVLPLAAAEQWVQISFNGSPLTIAKFIVDDNHFGAVAVLGDIKPNITFYQSL